MTKTLDATAAIRKVSALRALCLRLPHLPTPAEVERLRRQNEKLARDLARTQAALDIMGKAHALLELLSESAEPTREQGPSK